MTPSKQHNKFLVLVLLALEIISFSDSESVIQNVNQGNITNSTDKEVWTTGQIGRQVDIASVATGSEVADSMVKITGFAFKFLTQTIESVVGKDGLTGVVQNVYNPKPPTPRPKPAPKINCNVSRGPALPPRPPRPPLQEHRSEQPDQIPAKAKIYNLIANHENVAQLFTNNDDEKLLAVVAIASKSRIIPLVVNAVDLKKLKVDNSSESFYLDFANETFGYGQFELFSNKTNRQDLEEVVEEAAGSGAETALKVTGYIFGYLTETVKSVFGSGQPPVRKSNNISCGAQAQFQAQKYVPRSEELQYVIKENETRKPELRIRNDYVNKIFNISNNEDQKILGIVAILSKEGVFPLVVSAIDIESIEDNPLSNVFRNWDQILEATQKIDLERGPKDEVEIEVVKHIQTLRKAHPWFLPNVF